MTIWFDWRWGAGFLVGSGVAFLTVGLLPNSGMFDAAKTIRSTLDDTDLAGLPQSLRDSKQKSEGVLLVIVVLAGPVFLLGFVLFLIGLFDGGRVLIVPIVLMVVASIAFATVIGIDVFRDYRYLTLIKEARSRLESGLSGAVATNSDEVSVSPAELDALSRAETRRRIGSSVAR